MEIGGTLLGFLTVSEGKVVQIVCDFEGEEVAHGWEDGFEEQATMQNTKQCRGQTSASP